MIKFLLVVLFLFLFFRYPIFKFILFHPIAFISNGIKDVYNYFRYKKYNNCMEFGKIRLNSAKTSQVFGCGKTLSLVRTACEVYNKYNGKQVWDNDRKCFVIQHIHIISNVRLFDVPYIPWESEKQFIDIDKMGFEPQDITIYLLDEAGTIFNSRNFRDNISMEFLTRLLQSRKNKMCLYMTAQRFQFTDKILRESCSTVTTCRKIWRIIEICDYDAFELENVGNTRFVQPLSTRYWLASDKDYHSYDSYQLIEKLKKMNNDKEFLSTQEILETYGDTTGDINQITKPNKLFKNIQYAKNGNVK